MAQNYYTITQSEKEVGEVTITYDGPEDCYTKTWQVRNMHARALAFLKEGKKVKIIFGKTEHVFTQADTGVANTAYEWWKEAHISAGVAEMASWR